MPPNREVDIAEAEDALNDLASVVFDSTSLLGATVALERIVSALLPDDDSEDGAAGLRALGASVEACDAAQSMYSHLAAMAYGDESERKLSTADSKREVVVDAVRVIVVRFKEEGR